MIFPYPALSFASILSTLPESQLQQDVLCLHGEGLVDTSFWARSTVGTGAKRQEHATKQTALMAPHGQKRAAVLAEKCFFFVKCRQGQWKLF